MAKTFTKQEPVSTSFFGTDPSEYATGDSNDGDQCTEIVDQLKSLRYRPSFSSVSFILQYAQSQQSISMN